ncbi:hypothetical protein DSECCO2_522260 [anaerobic digester metagenome]
MVVALAHDFEEGLVDHGHFLAEIAVDGVAHDAAHDHAFLGQMPGRGEVEGEVGKRALPAPARGGVEVEDELLHGLLDFAVGKAVLAHERGEVGVHVVEGLRPGPFVLQRAEEVDHLAEHGVEVLGRAGAGAPGQVEAFEQQVAQAPAGAVAGEAERKVVDVEVAVVVGLAHFLGIFAERVAGLHRAGEVQHEPLERVGHVGVFRHAPVGLGDVVVDDVGDVEVGGFLLAQFAALFAVDDVAPGHGEKPRLHEHLLHGVLDGLLFGDVVIDKLGFDLVRQARGEQRVLDAAGLEGLEDRLGDALGGPGFQAPVAFSNLFRHGSLPPPCSVLACETVAPQAYVPAAGPP